MVFEYLNFPAVPEKIKQEILHTVEQNIMQLSHDDQHNIYANKEVLEKISMAEPNWDYELGIPLNQSPSDAARFYFFEVADSVKDWIKSNIPMPVKGVNVQVMTGGSFVVPHIDEVRNKACNYIITSGGTDVETCFYNPITEYQHLKATAQTYFPKERLEKFEGVVIEIDKWHRLSVDRIHSVENLNPLEKRISLTLSFVNNES